MNDLQRNFLAMGKTVRDYLAGQAAVWNALPATQAAFDDLSTALTAADGVVAQQAEPISGVAADKAEVRDALEEQTLLVASVIEAYVAVSGNLALLDGVDVTPSMLDKASEQGLVDVASRVATAGTANLAALGDYGVTQENLDLLTARRDAFEAVRSAPQVARAERAGFTGSLPEKIREIRAILDSRLDKLLFRHRVTNPEFYAGYQAARVIYDRRGPSPAETAPQPVGA